MHHKRELEDKSEKKISRLFRGIQTEINAWWEKDWVSFVLTAFVFVLALLTLLTMAVIDWRGYSALPWGDMWDYWISLLRLRAHPFTMLIAQHNEHRILVARLFFLADQTFFEGRAIFLFICIFLIQLFHAVLLWRLTYSSRPRSKSTHVFLGSAAFICLFSALQYTNFTWSFQIQFVAVYFAVTGALASVMLFARRSTEGTPLGFFQGPRFWLYAAIVIGFIATYSMANGLLVWPLLLLTANWLGLQRREKAIICTAGIAAWVLYLWGYTTPLQHSSILEGFLKLPRSFVYAMCVLGSPLDGILSVINRALSLGGEKWRLIWTATGGVVGLIIGCSLWVFFLVNRRKANRAEVVILHVLLFVMATAFLIGLGRANFPLQSALQSRYTTPALLFWFCILFLISTVLEENSPTRDRRPLLIFRFASTVILVVIVLYQHTQIQYAHDTTVYESEAEAAISAPVYDEEIWRRIYYNPQAMIPAVQYLQSNHFSVFALERLKWLGDPITMHYQAVSPNRCTGFFDDALAIEDQAFPGVRAQGWSWDLELKRTAEKIVFTNGRGQIVGFGYTGFERPDVPRARGDIGSAEVGWKGYIGGLKNELIAAHMVTDAGRSSCSIGTKEITRFVAVPFEQIGEALEDVPVKVQGAWVKDGYYPGSERPPVKTAAMGSYVRGDQDTGTLRLGPFETGSYDTIALPILTGPVSRGLSIVVIDSRSGNTVAQLSPPPVLMKWRAWKVLLPRHDMRLEIVAQDQGAEWGEWMAVGMPHRLK